MRLQYFRGNIFVANLPPEITDDQLAEAFDPFGMVLSAFVARDPASGKRLRYGFVDIATERAAQRAVEAMNGAALDGHSLDVRISERPAPKKPPPRAGAPAHRAPARVMPRRTAEDHDGRCRRLFRAAGAAPPTDLPGRAPAPAAALLTAKGHPGLDHRLQRMGERAVEIDAATGGRSRG